MDALAALEAQGSLPYDADSPETQWQGPTKVSCAGQGSSITGSIPHTQQLYPRWETSQYCAFSSFYFYTFFCIKKKSIITTNYKGLKQTRIMNESLQPGKQILSIILML